MSNLGVRRRSSVLPSSLASAKITQANGHAPSGSTVRPTTRWSRVLKQVGIYLSLLVGFIYLLRLARNVAHPEGTISWFPGTSSLYDSPRICPDCNTSIPGSYLASPSFSTVNIPTRNEVRRSKPNSPVVARYLLHHIVIEPVMHKIWLTWETAGKLLVNYFTHPDTLLAYNFDGLRQDTPTLYMYTRTGPGGKLADTTKRIKYFSRHVDAVRGYNELIAEKGFLDETPTKDRQLIWIVVEDNAQIDLQLADYLKNTSIPYIYFAHGPTNWLGVAQWNAVDRAVDILRSTFYADGPVINVDDDSRILPELLRRVWRVQRAITWPVGNLGPQWEGLMCKNGKQDYWRLGGLPERVFPLDMNGFAINSSMIGPQGPIAPPYYVDFDLTGAETVFLQRIYSKREEIECLCDDTIAEDCFVSWHNWEEQPERNVPGLTA